MIKRHIFNLADIRSPEVFMAELEKLGYKAAGNNSQTEDYCFYDVQSGALFKAGYRLYYNNTAGRFALERNRELILEQNAPAAEVMGTEVYFPRAELKRKLVNILQGHGLIPHLKAAVEKRFYTLKSPVTYDIEVVFTGWSFSPPHGGEFVRDRLMIEIPEEDTSSVVPYLITLIRDLFKIEESVYDPLPGGLSLLKLSLPGAPVPAQFRITGTDSLLSAGKKIFSGQAFKMRANREGTARDWDIEFLHDLRVATRRARFGLRLFSRYLGKDNCQWLRTELAWIARILGDVRDLDVFLAIIDGQLEEVDASEEFGRQIHGFLRQKRQKALEQLRQSLSTERFQNLVEKLDQFTPRHAHPELAALQDQPVTRHSARFINKAAGKIGKWLNNPGPEQNDRALHQLRIMFKRLRYTTEFFKDLYGEQANRAIKDFKQFQDCLGLFQDACVAMDNLNRLLEEMAAAGPLSTEFVLTMGALIQVQRGIRNRRRDEFKKKWQKLPERLKLLNEALKNAF